MLHMPDESRSCSQRVANNRRTERGEEEGRWGGQRWQQESGRMRDKVVLGGRQDGGASGRSYARGCRHHRGEDKVGEWGSGRGAVTRAHRHQMWGR